MRLGAACMWYFFDDAGNLSVALEGSSSQSFGKFLLELLGLSFQLSKPFRPEPCLLHLCVTFADPARRSSWQLSDPSQVDVI